MSTRIFPAMSVATLLGASAAAWATGFFLEGSPLWISVVVGGLVGLFAAATGDTLVEGLILSAIVAALVTVVLVFSPLPEFPRQLLLAGGVGLVMGRLSAGVYYDFFARRPWERTGAESSPDEGPSPASDAPVVTEARENGDVEDPGIPDSGAQPPGADSPKADPTATKEGAPVRLEPPTPAVSDPPPVFLEYSTVRVVRLRVVDRFFMEGMEEVARRPVVGDEGIIVDVDEGGEAPYYTVECILASDRTIWVADFAHDELELLSPPHS